MFQKQDLEVLDMNLKFGEVPSKPNLLISFA